MNVQRTPLSLLVKPLYLRLRCRSSPVTLGAHLAQPCQRKTACRIRSLCTGAQQEVLLVLVLLLLGSVSLCSRINHRRKSSWLRHNTEYQPLVEDSCLVSPAAAV